MSKYDGVSIRDSHLVQRRTRHVQSRLGLPSPPPYSHPRQRYLTQVRTPIRSISQKHVFTYQDHESNYSPGPASVDPGEDRTILTVAGRRIFTEFSCINAQVMTSMIDASPAGSGAQSSDDSKALGSGCFHVPSGLVSL
jgi:hypothetical protein